MLDTEYNLILNTDFLCSVYLGNCPHQTCLLEFKSQYPFFFQNHNTENYERIIDNNIEVQC